MNILFLQFKLACVIKAGTLGCVFIDNETHTRVVSIKCTPGFACRAFSATTRVCFIVNEHTTKCSHYNDICPISWNRDYFYGIWHDKIHSIKKLLRSTCKKRKMIEIDLVSEMCGHNVIPNNKTETIWPPWASCQIRKIAGAHAPGMPGTFSPPPNIAMPPNWWRSKIKCCLFALELIIDDA